MGREDQQRVSDLDQSEVSLGELLLSLRRQIRLNMHVRLPASVVAYNPATEKAQVTIGWLEIVRNLQLPVANAEMPQLPKIITVRVAWADNGSGDGSRFPIPPNATGTVTVFDRDLNTWLASPPGVPVDPMFAWNHELKDSTFWPDLRPDTVPLVPVANPAAHVIKASTALQLGGDLAVLGVARLTDTVAPNASMAAWIAAVSAATAVPAPVGFGDIATSSTKVVSE